MLCWCGVLVILRDAAPRMAGVKGSSEDATPNHMDIGVQITGAQLKHFLDECLCR